MVGPIPLTVTAPATATTPPTSIQLATSELVEDVVTSLRHADAAMMSFVPAGPFVMGSDDGEPNERPAHEVLLDAFWIDQTEITNGMYRLCVLAGDCAPPGEVGSETRVAYYALERYADYPVLLMEHGLRLRLG
jgi:formylglycine-generating enzyme required for sulfatase activity